MKRLISLLLSLMLALAACVPALAEEPLPTEWDLTTLYATPEDWYADYDKVIPMFDKYDSMRGTLNTPENIRAYYDYGFGGEMTLTQDRLRLYAQLRYKLDASDPVAQDMLAKLDAMVALENSKVAFVEEELFSLPKEEREALLQSPELEPIAYYLSFLVDPHYEPMSEETLIVLSTLSPAMGRASSTFDVMNNVDLPYPTVTLPTGEEVELTQAMYDRIVESDEYSREFKAQCNKLMLAREKPFINTFASLLNTQMSAYWAYAQVNGFDTTREYFLHMTDIDPAVYDMLVAAAHKGLPDYHRYLDAHRRSLGLDEQYPFDRAVCASDYKVASLTYEEAVAQVREALSVLGEDYIAKYDELIENGHVDVYPTATKETGANSSIGSRETGSYILLNFAGLEEDANTLAHEMGHALYTQLSSENPDVVLNWAPTTFTDEVASTTNEMLYNQYRIDNAANDDERLYYLERQIKNFSSAFFSQVQFAEFEDYAYKTIENGGALDAETISDKYMELVNQYEGGMVTRFPDTRYYWSTIPHFYMGYYVYQYATSITYAASICQRILGGEPGAVEAYKTFLSLGSSASPVDLLATAGVDPLSEQTYADALAYFSGLVDEYEALINAR